MSTSALLFDVFSLFPEVFEPYLHTSILQRAITRGVLKVQIHNIRDWTTDRHHVTDDVPYGGGGGMVMKPEPIFAAIEDVLGKSPKCPIIFLTPQGRLFNRSVAEELIQYQDNQFKVNIRIALICGKYEGVDERVREHLVTDEISIGDYVLTGGELAAMIVIDAVTRLIPGVLGDPTGASDDSHAEGLLEYPHYTRPPVFRDWQVPDVLLSGDHARIEKWRREKSLQRTWERRPDLLKKAKLSKEDIQYIQQLKEE